MDPGALIGGLILHKLVAGTAGLKGACAASAASIPDFIALWDPLIRGTLTKPAEQPISAPPGK